jgi:hypothetical protein
VKFRQENVCTFWTDLLSSDQEKNDAAVGSRDFENSCVLYAIVAGVRSLHLMLLTKHHVKEHLLDEHNKICP